MSRKDAFNGIPRRRREWRDPDDTLQVPFTVGAIKAPLTTVCRGLS